MRLNKRKDLRNASVNPMRNSPMHKIVLYDEDITDTPVVTLLRLCDARVAVCYGCSYNLKLNSITPNPPFDSVVVVKMRQEFRQNGLMQFSAPSSTYFHVVHVVHVVPVLHAVRMHCKWIS